MPLEKVICERGSKLNNRERYNELLLSTNREGIMSLITELHGMGFYTCPCSTQYHLAKDSGLLEHSLNVYDTALKVYHALDMEEMVPRESVVIAALLHDIGKVGDYGKKNYILSGNIAKPYTNNKELKYIPHEVRSIVLANRFIHLTEDEQYAIYYHNGKYTNIGQTLKEHTPLEMLIHFADMYSCFELEKGEEVKDEQSNFDGKSDSRPRDQMDPGRQLNVHCQIYFGRGQKGQEGCRS